MRNGEVLGLALIATSALAFMNPACAVCDPGQPTRTPTSRYAINNGEIYDKKTDLTWQRCSVGQRWKDGTGCVGVIRQMSWQEAMSQGSDGWRVPTKDELSTLISPTCKRPAINEEAFPDLDLDKLWYWSSTEDGAYLAWLADFADGRFTNYDRTDVGAVRLVRPAQ